MDSSSEKERAAYGSNRELGRCVDCGVLDQQYHNKRVRCEKCHKAHLERCRNRKAERRAKGLCARCAVPVELGAINCDECRAKNNVYEKARREKRKAGGNCPICNKPRDTDLLRCMRCTVRGRQHERERRERARKADLCHTCAKRPMLPGLDKTSLYPRCEVCYMKGLASDYLGTTKRWRELKDLFEAQGGKCPYTGVDLILGFNDSLDHKNPRARFPDQMHDIANLEWVCLSANFMKRNKTREEFLEFCAWITQYTGTSAPVAPTAASVVDGFHRPFSLKRVRKSAA